MSGFCANPACSTQRHNHDGILFRVDIELGSISGTSGNKTAYVWLCSRCAALMIPKVEVTKTAVRIRLASTETRPPSFLVN